MGHGQQHYPERHRQQHADNRRLPDECRPAGHAALLVPFGAAPKGGAAVRSAARSRAERARGLAATSRADGRSGRRVISRNDGRALRASRRCREMPRDARLAAAALSQETSSPRGPRASGRRRPPAGRPDASSASAAARPRSSSPSSSFTAMRSAWKVRVAGSMPSAGARQARSGRSRPAARVPCDRRRRPARGRWRAAMRRGEALLAVLPDQIGEFVLAAARSRHRRRARRGSDPCACRADRRSGRRSRAPAVSSCIEETPRSKAMPSMRGDVRAPPAVAGMSPKRPATTVSRPA